MDNITHTMIGVGLARAGLSTKFGRGTTWILAIASNLPDLDVFIGLFGIENAFLLRRMFTHSVLGVPIIALAVSFLFSRLFPNLKFKTICLLTIVGMAVHVFFDLVNSYGVVFLYPFSGARYELAWIFIIDLAIWMVLLLPLFLTLLPWFRNNPGRKAGLWKTAMISLAVYVSLCGVNRWQSDRLLKREAEKASPNATDHYVFPEALGFHRFRGVLRVGDEIRLFQIKIFTGEVVLYETFHTVENDPRLKSLKESDQVRRLLWFMKRPVFRWVDDTTVELFDVRFISTVLRSGRAAFAFRFEVPA